MPIDPTLAADGPDADGEPESADHLADRLKERVYVTFTALAVLIALGSHGEPPSAGSVALSLVLTTLGVLLAGFAADVIAHSTVHSALPTGPALRHMSKVATGAFGAIATPLLLLVLAGFGVISTTGALIASQVVLVVALGAFALIALRRMQFTAWRKIVLAAILVVVGAVVILVELLAHSL